jgi:hypothetical protein
LNLSKEWLMRKTARDDIVWIFLCLVSLLFGCAPEVRRQAVLPPQPETQAIPPLQLEGLDRKIASLEQILLKQDLSNEDRMTAQNLLIAYGTIKEDLKYPLMTKDYHKIIGLLYANLGQMDESYFEKAGKAEKTAAQEFQLFSEKKKEIISSYASGNYQAVIDGCVEMEKEFGTEAMPAGIGLLYALSLGEAGKVAEALRLSETLSPELEKTPGFVQLQAKSIEWQLALGNREDAAKTLEKLLGTLKDREALVKLAEQKLLPEVTAGTVAETPSEGVGTPSGTVAPSETPAPSGTAAPSETPAPSGTAAKGPANTEEVLKKAEELARGGEYEKAKILLLQHKLRLGEGPQTEPIDRALENIEIREATTPAAVAKEQQAAIASEETLRVASALIEGEKYEEALAKLEELEKIQALPKEALDLQALAVEKIIKRERKKAAGLFLLARNTADPAKKEELLKSSYDILKAVAEKYPSSPLNKKINDNMRSIQFEISKIKKQAG